MRKMILYTIALLICCRSYAQDIYAPILEEIAANNLTIKALEWQADADRLQHRVGISLPNPEVEFGYLFGANSTAKKDISIMQPFNFPSVYVRQNKLANLQAQTTGHQFNMQRAEIMLTAKKACIDLIYNNALYKLYSDKKEYASKTLQAVEKLYKVGEATQIEYNQAVMNQSLADNELGMVALEKENLHSLLSSLNGGNPITFDIAAYSPEPLPLFDTLYNEALATNPLLQYLYSQALAAEQQVKVQRSAAFPKLAVGYGGEFAPDEHFQGIKIGLTIPLWENANTIRHAKSSYSASSAQYNDALLQYRLHLESLYKQAVLLQQNCENVKAKIAQNNNPALLYKAYEAGEMPLITYLQSSDYNTDVAVKYIEALHKLELLLSDLFAYKL